VEWGAFDAIFLINLPDREDRKRELERELRSVGLETDNPKLVWIRAVRPLDAGEFPSIGARGCFMSHLTCLRSAMDSGHSRILILEDDACFPKPRVGGLKGVLKKLEDPNWAIWYGGGHMLHDLSPGIDSFEIIALDHTVGVQTSHCIALQGGAIDSVKSFFELILTRRGGHPVAGPMHVDGAYSTWRALNPVAVTLISAPPVCVQRLSRSDIATTRWFDRSPFLQSGVAAIRRLRNYVRHHI
jgi:glycosyl transferase family 25